MDQEVQWIGHLCPKTVNWNQLTVDQDRADQQGYEKKQTYQV